MFKVMFKVIGWAFMGLFMGTVAMQTFKPTSVRQAEAKKKGLHCLSGDRHHPGLNRYIKERLPDPNAYKPQETVVGPVRPYGTHDIVVIFYATNKYGNPVTGAWQGIIDNETCALLSAVDLVPKKRSGNE